MRAFKAMSRDLKCRGFQFKVGETYEIEGKPELCVQGFHFCLDIANTLMFYQIKNDVTENCYAEIEVLGDIEFQQPNKFKGVTNKIKIIRLLDDEEVKSLFSNDGKYNTGDYNTGNRNTGDRNTGNWNSCNFSAGFFNTEESQYIEVFNKPCLRVDWINAEKPSFLYFTLDPLLGYKGSFQKAFETSTENDIKLLKELPNFDKEVFFEISGIMIN